MPQGTHVCAAPVSARASVVGDSSAEFARLFLQDVSSEMFSHAQPQVRLLLL